MKAENNREDCLFREALKRATSPERQAFLDRACMGDQALRARLEALLLAHESPDSFLESPLLGAGQATVVLPPEEGPGTVIGRYKILEKVGEGGFGVVYVAEQREPVKRRVALKIIKLGMDTRQVVARFEAERQALALMDHPNIAKVLDAGATENGRPFFVMELVKGIPITKYCEQEKTETTEKLKFFIQICHAIQHAHQKGIIHRDIKPSNILVTLHDGVPVPKVIDFGLLMGAPFPFKHLRNIKTPQRRFSPDKSLTNGPENSPHDAQNFITSTGTESFAGHELEDGNCQGDSSPRLNRCNDRVAAVALKGDPRLESYGFSPVQ
jgi:hypothetical protein